MTDEAIQTAIVERDTLIIEVLPIKTDDDRLRYNAARVQVKDWLARFTVVEKDICDPIYRAWKNAKDRFKDGRKPAEDFDAALERELRADRQRQLEAQAKEQARLDALAQKRFDRAVEKGKPTPLPVPVAAVVQDVGKSVETDNGKVTWVDNWVPEIYDEKLLPREYLMPDMAKLNAAAKAGIEVPGVKRVNRQFQRVSR
jgi:hypothetical protein